MGAWPHVVFPRTHVLIAQDGAQPMLTTPNHVVFYRPHQRYRRALRDPRGDRSRVARGLTGAARGGGRRAARRAGQAVGRAHVPARGGARSHLASARPTGCWPRRRAAAARPRAWAAASWCAPTPARADPRRARGAGRGGEGAARRADRPTRRRSASSPAALYVSPFHLARVFRARTGFSLSGYVHGLRLRRAVDRLAAEPDVDLSRLALELGYCSPSHFTDRFRAAFGRPPSALRGTQLRTIVEARARRRAASERRA